VAEVRLVQASELLQHLSEVLQVYGDAFAPPPYRYTALDVSAFDFTLQTHTRRAGFKACAAFDDDGRLVGFTYGYTTAPGQWWRDLVVRALSRQDAERWFDDCFEYVELAVAPAAQGRGFGAQLHDMLVADLPHRTAALSTAQEMTRAQQMYLSRGWQIIVPHFDFPNRPHPYAIMGLDLAHRRQAAGSLH
jgi:GNAT superfamily N-acetyltransferase